MKRYIFLAFAAFLAPAGLSAAEPTVASSWVQLGPGGGAEVREVVNGRTCVEATVNGAPVGMTVRAEASTDFPLVCGLALPAGTKTLAIEGHALALPVKDPQRILVLGDTGCRIKGAYLQACNDSKAWPFAGLAQAAANLKPDLIVHLGDYLYRESPCPAGNAGCAGSPYGDNWASWNADFFTPGAPLLGVAPWVVIRGNHEDCSRAGPGFLRLLGPIAFDPKAACIDHLEPYGVTLGRQRIAVIDTASAPDQGLDDKVVATYQKDLGGLKALGAGHPLWLATHRPIWAAITGPGGLPVGGNVNLIQAAGNLRVLAPVSLMLAGHIHSFEAINYVTNNHAPLPPQIVAGHGGDNLDVTPADLHHTIFQGHSGVNVKDGLSVGGFGFLMMTREAGSEGWSIQLYDSDGTPTAQCAFEGGRVFCLKPR